MRDLQDIQRDMDRLRSAREVLDRLLEMTEAQGAFVFDRAGESVVEAGALEGDVSPLAARLNRLWLDAASVADMVGELAFEEQVLLGGRHHVFLARSGLDHSLAVLFDSGTTLGLVRLYTLAAADRLGSLLLAGGADSDE